MMSYLRKSKLEVAVTVLSGKHPSALRSSFFQSECAHKDHLPSGDDGSRRDSKLEKVAMLSEKLEVLGRFSFHFDGAAVT